MINKKIFVLDQTLRDGEQQALINFNKKQKIKLANKINEVGCDYIDLMPISNEIEQDIVKELSNLPLLLSTPVTDKSINLSTKLKKDIILFQAVSDELLKIRKISREENIQGFLKYLKNIRRIIGDERKIFIAGEDSGRANIDYLVKFIKKIKEYIDGFFIADSTGCMNPIEVSNLVKTLKKETQILIGIHAHNDQGFANENTIKAVLAGAEIISGTFTGIGERAGNANLGEVLIELKDKHNLLFKNIKYDKIKQLENLIRSFAKMGPAKPNTKKAFYVESGIHVHALLKSPTAYSFLNPKVLGFKHKVFFGKNCGVSNFIWYFGDSYSIKQYEIWRDKIKKLSIEKNISFSIDEVKRLLNLKKQIIT